MKNATHICLKLLDDESLTLIDIMDLKTKNTVSIGMKPRGESQSKAMMGLKTKQRVLSPLI